MIAPTAATATAATTQDDWIPRNTPGRRGPKPGTPEARKGGLAVARRYGSEFYSTIGKKGGTTVKQRMGTEFYSRIGHLGGTTTSARYGPDYYSTIGRQGGKAGGKAVKRRHILAEIDGP